MAGTFSFHLIDMLEHFRGPGDRHLKFWGKVVMHLQRYMDPVVAKSGVFDSAEVWWCPNKYVPSMLDTDVAVYVVPDVKNSVIAANGGSASMAINNPNLLGLTATVLNICEIYYDREYHENPKVIAGAAFHEAVHLKSQMGEEMHSNKDGFLTASPAYYSNPSDKNIDFFASVIGRKVKQSAALKPKGY